MWCVVVCDLEKTNLVNEEGQGPLRGYRAKRKKVAVVAVAVVVLVGIRTFPYVSNKYTNYLKMVLITRNFMPFLCTLHSAHCTLNSVLYGPKAVPHALNSPLSVLIQFADN
jgi:hypothetical protein